MLKGTLLAGSLRIGAEVRVAGLTMTRLSRQDMTDAVTAAQPAVWTVVEFEGDDDAMRRHRLRQGNLMGPAGFLGLEDNEAMKFVQDGLTKSSQESAAIVELGGREEGTSTTLITEAAIRSMYRYYRGVMDL